MIGSASKVGHVASRRRREWISLNGKLFLTEKARISPRDYGYLYGYAVFETMRAYRGQVFRLNSHLERLTNSAEEIGIKPTKTRAIADDIYRTLRKNHHADAYVRATLSAGEGAIGLDPRSCSKPTVSILTKKFRGYPSSKYATGFRAVTSTIRTSPNSYIAKTKSTSFLDRLLARGEALKADADEAIMINTNGFIAEGSVSNVFFIFGNQLHTPDVEQGLLAGVTRNVTIQLAEKLRIKVIERGITVEEIMSANEAFITNSLAEVMPLTTINGVPLSSGAVGAITRQLMGEYKALVRRELA